MPTLKKLYTLSDIKELLAKTNNVDINNVDVFMHETLEVEMNFGEYYAIKEDSYLFQVTLKDSVCAEIK